MIDEYFFNDKVVRTLIENPHLLGHLMGKDKLNELHSEWIKYCWDSNEPRALQAFRGGYKCFSPDTDVMMSDGSSRKIKDVNIGDYVMGWDSKPRRVLEKHSGKDSMYRVSYKKTKFHYDCNSQHELVLKVSDFRMKNNVMRKFDKYIKDGFYIVPVCDFVTFPKYIQEDFFAHRRSSGLDFPKKEVLIDPYLFGTWLGDGGKSDLSITTPDKEIIDYWENYCSKFDLQHKVYGDYTHRFTCKTQTGVKRGFSNKLWSCFTSYNLNDNKHIPEDYVINDRETRLQLLAGLLDTDGHWDGSKFSLSNTNEQMIDSTLFIAKSLGLNATKTEYNGGCDYKGEFKPCRYFIVYINGNVEEIPTRVPRKKGKNSKTYTNCDNLTFHQTVESIGIGDFVGIQIEGDGIFLLSDFSLVHNSTAVDVVGIVRWFLLQPNDRIALIRKSFNDACTVVSAVRQAMELPQIKELFKFAHGFYPKAMTAKDGKLRYNFKTTITPEVSLTAHGIDSSLTGMHYDKIICDDIITLKDRISRAERIKTKEMVNEIATNIIDPHKGSIWVGTPWHRDDAWNEINSFCDIAQYPLSKYNFLGEGAAEKKKATTTPFLYAANYELEIGKDENSLFVDPRYSQNWNFFKRGYAHVDGAYDGDHYCAFTILSPLDNAEMPFSKSLQGIGWAYPGNVKDWVSFIIKTCKQYKVQYIFCETNPDKGYLASQLREGGLRVKTYAETENKHVKISTNLYEYWEKILWSPNTDPEYMNQILDYREGSEPDDAPDSCASLLREACKPSKAKSRSLYDW